MKKIAALCALACLATSFPAGARVDIGLNMGAPGPVYAEPSYMAPAPVPVYGVAVGPGYYGHRHYYHGRRDFHRR